MTTTPNSHLQAGQATESAPLSVTDASRDLCMGRAVCGDDWPDVLSYVEATTEHLRGQGDGEAESDQQEG